jgi:hypothetical protein
MPADHGPAPTCPHQIFIVELESDDRSPAAGGLSDNQGAVLAPHKMLVPDLAAWIKKGHLFAAFRVDAVCVWVPLWPLHKGQANQRFSSVEGPPAAWGMMCSTCMGIAVWLCGVRQ